MKNKQELYSKKRSFFTHPVMVLVLLAVLEGAALVRTFTLPADFWALTSLSQPFELVRHTLGLLVWGGLVFYAVRRMRAGGAAGGATGEAGNSVTWAQVMVLLCAFGVYTALHLALFARAEYDRQRLPFIGVGVCVLFIVTLGMRLKEQQASRIPFQVKSEEDIKDGIKPQD